MSGTLDGEKCVWPVRFTMELSGIRSWLQLGNFFLVRFGTGRNLAFVRSLLGNRGIRALSEVRNFRPCRSP